MCKIHARTFTVVAIQKARQSESDGVVTKNAYFFLLTFLACFFSLVMLFSWTIDACKVAV